MELRRLATGASLATLSAPSGRDISQMAWSPNNEFLDGYLEIDALVATRNEELANAQTSAVQSQKMQALGTLAAGIANDLNNLLSVIRMTNKLTLRDIQEEEAIRESARDIETAVEQGQSIVRSMLGYSRASEENEGEYSVADLVEDNVAMLSRKFLDGVTLTLELPEDLPDVRGSRHRVEQAFLNIVLNSVEAMSASGSLSVTCRAVAGPPPDDITLAPKSSDTCIQLMVKDTGPGIPKDILPRDFEPFFTTKNQGKEHGAGLGLSTVYTIAEKEGLGINIESEPGEGTAFSLFIPVNSKE